MMKRKQVEHRLMKALKGDEDEDGRLYSGIVEVLREVHPRQSERDIVRIKPLSKRHVLRVVDLLRRAADALEEATKKRMVH